MRPLLQADAIARENLCARFNRPPRNSHECWGVRPVRLASVRLFPASVRLPLPKGGGQADGADIRSGRVGTWEAGRPLAGWHSLRSMLEQEGSSRVILAVGIKRHPPTFSRFHAESTREHSDRLAGGSLRCRLTSEAGELVGGSLAASPLLHRDHEHYPWPRPPLEPPAAARYSPRAVQAGEPMTAQGDEPAGSIPPAGFRVSEGNHRARLAARLLGRCRT
jgi:hypothetical protein